MADNGRFRGMSAVITGGASGIGLAVARRILAEGGQITLWDLDPARLGAAISKVGAQSRARIRRRHERRGCRARRRGRECDHGRHRRARLQRGRGGENAPVIDYPIAEWKRVFDINVNGLFYCNRFVARLMKARGYGRIVNISSIAGKEGNPNASAYSASKAAVIGLTKSLGKELAKDGVTVNAVTPATVETPMLEQVSSAHIAYMRSKIPMERFGTVEEAASLICWLASAECSFSTGAVFDLSGGRATY